MCVHLDYNQGEQHQLRSLLIHPPIFSIFYPFVLIIIPCQYTLDLLASLLYYLSVTVLIVVLSLRDSLFTLPSRSVSPQPEPCPIQPIT